MNVPVRRVQARPPVLTLLMPTSAPAPSVSWATIVNSVSTRYMEHDFVPRPPPLTSVSWRWHNTKSYNDDWTQIILAAPTTTCLSNPCQNGGSCNQFFGGHSCRCDVGWEGINCEIGPTIPCMSNPCQNGATCSNIQSNTAYQCLCPDGLGGVNCETGTKIALLHCLQNKWYFRPLPNPWPGGDLVQVTMTKSRSCP